MTSVQNYSENTPSTISARDSLSVPFVRVTVKSIENSAFQISDRLRLVVLTQDYDDQSQSFKTGKITVLSYNRKAAGVDQEAWHRIDARIFDQERKLVFLLIEENVLFEMCPRQANNRLDRNVPIDSQYNYDNLPIFATARCEQGLKDLSFLCRRRVNEKTGHKTFLTNGAEYYKTGI